MRTTIRYMTDVLQWCFFFVKRFVRMDLAANGLLKQYPAIYTNYSV